MADKKIVNSQDKEDWVEVRLPRLEGQNANQDQYVSVNFKNYILRRGEYIKVPAEVAEVIRHSEEAADASFRYASEKALREPKKE